MGFLQKIKSVLGLDGATSSDTHRSGDVDVTVEREPSTEDEDAVKGTDTSSHSETPADDTTEEAVVAEGESDTGESAAVIDEAETDADTDADETDTDEAADDDTEAEADEAEDDAADEEADDAEPDGSTDPVTELNGIGPAYAERLSGQGIETVGELAVADPEAIAAETDLGAKRVADWVEQARAY